MIRRLSVAGLIMSSVMTLLIVPLATGARAVIGRAAGHLVIGSYDTDSILRFDAGTGVFVDEFVLRRSGRLNQPWAVLYGPHDHDLYASAGHFAGPGQIKAILRFDGETGQFKGEFVARGQLSQPHGFIFGPDGNLYVGDGMDSQARIARFDGRTGEYMDDFVPAGSGGLSHPLALVFGPSGRGPHALDLYVCDVGTRSILRYDGRTGQFVRRFVAGVADGLGHPFAFTFGPDGSLYVANLGIFGGDPAVLRFQGPAGRTPGQFIDTFIPRGAGGLQAPQAVLFGPDGNRDGLQDLYVGSSGINAGFVNLQHTSSVKRFDGVTGAFLDTFVREGSGGLDGPSLMTFTETDPVTLAYEPLISRGFRDPDSL